MLDTMIRTIQVSDYEEIYLLNLDFNPNLHVFSVEQVKKKIEQITTQTKMSSLFVNARTKSSGTYMAALMSCYFRSLW